MTHVAPVHKKELLAHCFAGKFGLSHKTGYGCQAGFFTDRYQAVVDGFSENIDNSAPEIAFWQLIELRIVVKNGKPDFRIGQRHPVYFINNVL